MPVIAVEDIVHVRYQAPDLDLMERFLLDFGLRRAERTARALYMRAAGGAQPAHITEQGTQARAIGFALRAQSAEDLQRLAAHAGATVQAYEEPGGGQVVRLRDPAGFEVEVLHGQSTGPAGTASPTRPAHVRNTAQSRERLGATVRSETQPSQVVRLGHVVLLVPQFEPVWQFYAELLGLRISDAYHGPDPAQTTFAFLHCGLGPRYTDHHTVALGAPPGGIDAPRFDHVAFEVLDLDDLMAGQAHLQAGGWTHSWGVGRHVLGSQLFDYWRDPYGHKIEHWTDGDLVNEHHVPTRGPMRPEGLSQWAPPITPAFFD